MWENRIRSEQMQIPCVKGRMAGREEGGESYLLDVTQGAAGASSERCPLPEFPQRVFLP